LLRLLLPINGQVRSAFRRAKIPEGHREQSASLTKPFDR